MWTDHKVSWSEAPALQVSMFHLQVNQSQDGRPSVAPTSTEHRLLHSFLLHGYCAVDHNQHGHNLAPVKDKILLIIGWFLLNQQHPNEIPFHWSPFRTYEQQRTEWEKRSERCGSGPEFKEETNNKWGFDKCQWRNGRAGDGIGPAQVWLEADQWEGNIVSAGQRSKEIHYFHSLTTSQTQHEAWGERAGGLQGCYTTRDKTGNLTKCVALSRRQEVHAGRDGADLKMTLISHLCSDHQTEGQLCEVTCKVVAVVLSSHQRTPVTEAVVPALGACIGSVWTSSPGALQRRRQRLHSHFDVSV